VSLVGFYLLVGKEVGGGDKSGLVGVVGKMWEFGKDFGLVG